MRQFAHPFLRGACRVRFMLIGNKFRRDKAAAFDLDDNEFWSDLAGQWLSLAMLKFHTFRVRAL